MHERRRVRAPVVEQHRPDERGDEAGECRRTRRRPARGCAARTPRPSAAGPTPRAARATARARTSRRAACGSFATHARVDLESRPLAPERLPGSPRGCRRTRGRRSGSATPRARAGRGRAARRRRARRGAGRARSPARPEPTSWCSTAEIARSMYIAASTIAAAPTTAHAQPCWNTPARIRNSPANERRERHGERDDADRHHHRRERRPAARHAAEQRELAGRRAPLDHARRAGRATTRSARG